MKKIYLAGPDVFEKDALEVGKTLKELCRDLGFEGLFPLDNVLEAKEPRALAKEIRHANLALIRQADIVMANLNPFRGFEPDSGTVYEVGFAEALGKPVFGYAEDLRTMKERLIESQRLCHTDEYCKEGKLIEDFQLSHNLMLSHTLIANDAKACLIAIKQHFSI
jgi:nucleoside 2-deoxyribosyltransferase